MPTGPTDFSSSIAGLRVAHHRIPVWIGDELARIGDVVGRIAALEVLGLPVEQRGRDRRIAFLRELVGDGADVLVDAEDFLDDHHAALGRAGRVGAIGAQLELVGGREREMLTQFDLP